MTNLINKLRSAVAHRAAYNRALAEIAKMDERELADLRTDRGVLAANAFEAVYGVARSSAASR